MKSKELAKTEAMDELRALVARNLTEAQREALVRFGVLDEETGLLTVNPIGLQSSSEVSLPMGDQQAVAFRGRIQARVGIPVVDIKMFKNKGGQLFASSNIIGATIKSGPNAGKRWTTYNPNFTKEQVEERAAWNALIGLLPKYAEVAGWV